MVVMADGMDGATTASVAPVEKKSVLSFARMKRPERPSREELNHKVSKVQEEISGLQTRVEEINALLNGRHQGKNSLSIHIVEAKKRLSELAITIDSISDEKRNLEEELEMADKAREQMRREARLLREKLPYVCVEEIDEEIKRIEYRIANSSLSSQEEQRLAKQLNNFRKSRDFVQDYTMKFEKLTSDQSSRSGLVDKIKEKERALDELKKHQEEERKIIASLKEKESLQLSDIPSLIEERSAAFDKIRCLRESIGELRSDFQSKEREYWAREKEWRQLQAMDRKLKFEKREAEWKEREEIRRQKQLENYVPPYTEELIICNQLLSYLQKFLPVEKEVHSPLPQAETISHKGFEDLQQIKKNRSDEDFGGWFSGLGSKGKPRKAKGLATGKSKERISLSIDALTSFQKVNLRPPLTVGDVASSLIELKAKIEQYSKLQSEGIGPSAVNGNDMQDSLQETAEGETENDGATSNSCGGQIRNDDKTVELFSVEETVKEHEEHIKVPIASEEHIEVPNGDEIKLQTAVKVHEDEIL